MKINIVIILLIILILPIVNAQTDSKIYQEITIEYYSEILGISKIEPIFLEKPPTKGEGEYKIESLDKNNKVIYSDNFNIELSGFVDYIDETENIIGGELFEFISIQKKVYIPYKKQADKLIIYKDRDQKILEYSLKEYLKTSENTFDETSEKSYQPKLKEKNNIWIYITIIIIILILTLIIYLIKRK